MPAKSKLSPAARRAAQVAEDKGIARSLANAMGSEETVTSSNGTKVNGAYMMKSDGSMYIREVEKRSRKHSVMYWRKLNA